MSKPTRTVADLNNLFDLTVDVFKDILTNGEEVVKDGERMRVKPSAATLGQIRQFLRDQNIQASPAHPGVSAVAEKVTSLPFNPSSADDSDEDRTYQ